MCLRFTRTYIFVSYSDIQAIFGTLKTKLDDVEEAVYMAMCDKIKRDGKDVPQ
ncbi:MAG: hypothetical protein K6B74_09630 [Ruminococcus sp.]|nr:hypothetical protein [Ruminococcus sp.]